MREFTNVVNESLFSGDAALQASLLAYSGEAEKKRISGILSEWERRLPVWDRLAAEASRPEKLPRVEKFDRVGNRIEKIIIASETAQIRRAVVAAGIFKNVTQSEMFAKIYLLAQLGESGVTCPLACTDGLIRVTDAVGHDAVRTKYRPLFDSVEYPLSGAQFITEIGGGSDVGAIEGKAFPTADGTWRVSAEKWYCSAYDEFFVVAARPEGAPAGTDGIALFFVPRLIEMNGKKVPNGLSIRRLKDKLGTQSLPTAEVDFTDAIAWPMGEPQDGFHHLMNYVLNVSRIHNAANSLGLARRAFAEARNYVSQRIAFGRALVQFPLVKETLADLVAEQTARLHLYFHMLAQIDAHGLLPADENQRLWQRFLINLLKYRTADTLSTRIKDCILLCGANGIIQDFSILPRLLRDSLIVETWEGPHNILCLQILRDGRRFAFTERLILEIRSRLDACTHSAMAATVALVRRTTDQLAHHMVQERLADPAYVTAHARRIVDLAGGLLEIAHLLEAGSKHQDGTLLSCAMILAHKRFAPERAFDNPVSGSLSGVIEDLVNENHIDVQRLRG